ncbi:hypothetical protein H0H87_006249 [Tephrocybe sp. NHM501043]|nr:hypothetical protein H0H87_006249 [Tephrocybe sp. NHM501043]
MSPIGVLRLGIQSAHIIPWNRLRGSAPDPFVTVNVAGAPEAARTQHLSHEYVLKTQLNFIAEFVLNWGDLRLYDHHEHRRHSLLGEARFDLSQLKDDAAHGGHDLPLSQDAKRRGDLLVNIAYYPVSDAKGASEYSPGVVTLNILEARRLELRASPAEDFSAVAQLRLGYDGVVIYATRRKAGTNPVWKATHAFYCPTRVDCMIDVKIVDEEGVVGELLLSLDDLLDGNRKAAVNHPPSLPSPPQNPFHPTAYYRFTSNSAAVALIIRVVPSPSVPAPSASATPPTLTEFFEQDWVNDPNAKPEILFLHRHNASADEISLAQQSRSRNTQESHVAFPGGRMEPEDEGGLYTAMRQTWEEIGFDLAERQYTCVGQLDDREITTSLGKRLLMILSPFVFLQVTPHAPPPDPIESTTLHWIPLASFVSPSTPPRWSTVTVDAASRLAPKHNTALRLLVRLLIGTMEFPAILLDTHNSLSSSAPLTDAKSQSKLEKGVLARPPQNLKLWGLSLGMTLDLMSYMIFPPPTSRFSNPQEDADSAASSPLLGSMQLPYQAEFEGLRMDVVAPSLASVFPRFSYPDVNFWIWVFGKRYRSVVRGWEASVRSGGTNDRRYDFSCHVAPPRKSD